MAPFIQTRRTFLHSGMAAAATLALTIGVYLVVAVAALLAAGPDRLAGSSAPLVAALDAVSAECVERGKCLRLQ